MTVWVGSIFEAIAVLLDPASEKAMNNDASNNSRRAMLIS
jgi:hypothetical protein